HLQAVDGRGEGEDAAQGKNALRAAEARDHRAGVRAGACGPAAAGGSGRNTGPTTLIRFSSPACVGLLTPGVSAMRRSVCASSPPSRFASVSGSAAGSGRELG